MVLWASLVALQACMPFPTWATYDASDRALALRFTGALQTWAARERARVRRELIGAQVLELHGANHYVFDSNAGEVIQAMKAFFARSETEEHHGD